MSTDITATAELIYTRFLDGFLTGTWDPFFEHVADEVDFAWPTNPGAGEFHGAEGRALMEKNFRVFGGDYRMTDIERTTTTVAGDTVFFEDRSRGDMNGTPYHARHCIIFTIRDEKLVGYREYIAQQPDEAS